MDLRLPLLRTTAIQSQIPRLVSLRRCPSRKQPKFSSLLNPQRIQPFSPCFSGILDPHFIGYQQCSPWFLHPVRNIKDPAKCGMWAFHPWLRYSHLEDRVAGFQTDFLLQYFIIHSGNSLVPVLATVLEMASNRSRLSAALVYLRHNKYRKIYTELSKPLL